MKMNRKKVLKVLGFAVAIVVLVFALLVIVTIFQSSSIDKRIAEFEANRKIPDSENAAIIYEKLFSDANYTDLLEDNVYKQMTLGEDCYKPWKSKDFPKEAEFVTESKIVLPIFHDIAEREKCVFPLHDDLQKDMDILSDFRGWATYLRLSANNDIGDGRFDEAIEKDRIMFKMANHIEQQPILVYYLVGVAVEALSLQCSKSIILDPNITEEQLQLIEKLPVKTTDDWNTVIQHIMEGERYYSEKLLKNYPFTTRYIMIFLSRKINKPAFDKIRQLNLRLLADKRGNRILIGLRRYKNQNGQWPDSLEQIKSLVEPIVLIDPQNGGSFVYKKTDSDFILYSGGPNNIDEGGDSNSPADDWPIWIPPKK
jgi:hypothetical protein